MAIEINLTESQYGVPFAGAYFRIATVVISRTNDQKDRHSVMLDVVGYATQPTYENTREIDFRRYSTKLSEIELQPGSSFFAKCYYWVMQQPDMVGAIGA